eukprot:gene35463-41860_t
MELTVELVCLVSEGRSGWASLSQTAMESFIQFGMPIKCDGGVFSTNYGGTNPYLGPGSLLALNSSIDIYKIGLTSPPGLAVAWTLQNYGAYV